MYYYFTHVKVGIILLPLMFPKSKTGNRGNTTSLPVSPPQYLCTSLLSCSEPCRSLTQRTTHDPSRIPTLVKRLQVTEWIGAVDLWGSGRWRKPKEAIMGSLLVPCPGGQSSHCGIRPVWFSPRDHAAWGETRRRYTYVVLLFVHSSSVVIRREHRSSFLSGETGDKRLHQIK